MAASLIPDWLRELDEENSGVLLALILFAGYYFLRKQKEKKEEPVDPGRG